MNADSSGQGAACEDRILSVEAPSLSYGSASGESVMSMDAIGAASLQQARQSLTQVLGRYSRLAVAVSGGVDSMTLSAVAHEVLGERLQLVHARSPAVPEEASERIQAHASRLGWSLIFVDAGEFSDQRYRQNPVNRCYYCKSNLYRRVREVWDGPIASGANLDDLGDYRPGLLAASERDVVHPLIEAGIDKPMVRAIARDCGLHDLAELPAQPCLSSRVETGLSIDPADLLFVHRMERFLSSRLGAGDLRCRITSQGVRFEIPEVMQQAHEGQWAELCDELERRVLAEGRAYVGVGAYQRGSAFLHGDEGA